MVLDVVFPAYDSDVNKSGRQSQSPTVRSVGMAFYHAWAALLGGEDYEWMTAPARILRSGGCPPFFPLAGGLGFTSGLSFGACESEGLRRRLKKINGDI